MYQNPFSITKTGRGLGSTGRVCFALLLLRGAGLAPAQASTNISEQVLQLFRSPPYVESLVYSYETESGTHFGLLRYQPNAFFAKTANSLAHLTSDKLFEDCRVGVKWNDQYWFYQGMNDPNLRVADETTGKGENSVAPLARGIQTGVYRIATEALNTLFLEVPVLGPRDATWSNNVVQGSGFLGFDFTGLLLSDETGLPSELRLRLQIGEHSGEQVIRYDYSTPLLAGIYPSQLHLTSIDSNTRQEKEIASIRILSVKTNRAALPASWFDHRLFLNDRVAQVIYYTNGGSFDRLYNDALEGKTILAIPKRQIPLLYGGAILFISAVILCLFLRYWKAPENQTITK
jgi:hypothetical protein